MDLETIQRINRDALKAAKAAQGESTGLGNQQMLMYAIAVAVAVGVYFLLQNYQPNFVMTTENGEKKFDVMRASIVSVISGLLVILCYHLMQ